MENEVLIICGGQTGVDIAAADTAIAHNVNYKGFVPKGRLNENGRLPDSYTNFCDTLSNNPSERTFRNALLSSAVLIIIRKSLDRGTRLTQFYANLYSRPVLILDVNNFEANVENPVFHKLRTFVLKHKVVNVAGPRESNAPGIYKMTFSVFDFLFKTINQSR